ncbi:hypothetical protein T12_16614 [Trichinella patagoniensis]|uniref:Uncharacterized protein n=1 Tax=Trichinella patagoniensis TaxID=990121 RepID=A0A0V0ZDQ2_9BILA|nr:hypothetical protein T12_16614 [Trichinella patagoniensis]
MEMKTDGNLNVHQRTSRFRSDRLTALHRVYAQKQRQVAQYTGEYTNGRRTLEQFLEALRYVTSKPI